jgi:hypothetical protein
MGMIVYLMRNASGRPVAVAAGEPTRAAGDHVPHEEFRRYALRQTGASGCDPVWDCWAEGALRDHGLIALKASDGPGRQAVTVGYLPEMRGAL